MHPTTDLSLTTRVVQTPPILMIAMMMRTTTPRRTKALTVIKSRKKRMPVVRRNQSQRTPTQPTWRLSVRLVVSSFVTCLTRRQKKKSLRCSKSLENSRLCIFSSIVAPSAVKAWLT